MSPEDLGDLADGDVDADARQVPDEDGLREQVGEEPKRRQAHGHEEQSDEEAKARSQAARGVGADGERGDGRRR